MTGEAADRRRVTGTSGGTRRRFLSIAALTAGAGVAGLAGCSAGVEGEPEPLVVHHEAEPPLADVTHVEPVTITVLVSNEGGPGSVRVVVETWDGASREGEPLDTGSATLEMDGPDQQEVTIEMDVSPAAVEFETRAEVP